MFLWKVFVVAAVTLDSIREAAERKFGNVEIEFGEGRVCVLRSPLRLGKVERDRLSELSEAGETVEDAVEQARESIRLVATNRKDADALLRVIGDDVPTLFEVIGAWHAGCEAGEA